MITTVKRIITLITRHRDPKFQEAEDRYERLMRRLEQLDREKNRGRDRMGWTN